MGETNGSPVVVVPSGLYEFRIAGTDKVLRLKVRTTLKALQALYDALDDPPDGAEGETAPADPADKHDQYLDAVIRYIAEQCGVVLDQDEADHLSDALGYVQAEAKKKSLDRLRSLQAAPE